MCRLHSLARSLTASQFQLGNAVAFAAPFAKGGRVRGKLPGMMIGLDVLEAVSVGEDVPLWTLEPQKDLPGRRLAPRAVHDSDLPFLDEIVALHDRIEALDLVAHVENAGPIRWI